MNSIDNTTCSEKSGPKVGHIFPSGFVSTVRSSSELPLSKSRALRFFSKMRYSSLSAQSPGKTSSRGHADTTPNKSRSKWCFCDRCAPGRLIPHTTFYAHKKRQGKRDLDTAAVSLDKARLLHTVCIYLTMPIYADSDYARQMSWTHRVQCKDLPPALCAHPYPTIHHSHCLQIHWKNWNQPRWFPSLWI